MSDFSRIAPDGDQPTAPANATDDSTNRIKRPSLGWTEMIIGGLAYLVLTFASFTVFAVLNGGQPATVTVGAAYGVATLAAVAVAVAVRVRSTAALGLRATSLRWVLLGVGGGVLGWLINRGVILAYIALTTDVSNPQQALVDSAASGGWELAGLLLVGAVLVPFAEELLFRGVGYGALRRYGVALATVVSAVLFGLAHGMNVVFPAAIVIGVITALLYERSRSIWPPVIAHAVNNAILFITVAVILS